MSKRAGWKKTLSLIGLAYLLSDLAVYFEFAWWTAPVWILSGGLFSVAFWGKVKVMGTGGTVAVGLLGAVSFLSFVTLAKLYFPEEVVVWEHVKSPLKWILP